MNYQESLDDILYPVAQGTFNGRYEEIAFGPSRTYRNTWISADELRLRANEQVNAALELSGLKPFLQELEMQWNGVNENPESLANLADSVSLSEYCKEYSINVDIVEPLFYNTHTKTLFNHRGHITNMDRVTKYSLFICPLCEILTKEVGNETVCQDCLDTHFVCSDCNEWEHYDNSCSPIGPSVCESCYAHYNYCESCEESYHENNSGDHDHDDGVEELEDCEYKPVWKTFGTSKFPFYFGVEWELTTSLVKDTLTHFRNEYPEGLFFGKSDGSVAGLEIVSMPATMEYWNGLNIISPNCPRSCGGGGIHVHVSREPFSGEQIKRIIDFFNDNQAFIEYIAGRDVSEWAAIRSFECYRDTEFDHQLINDIAAIKAERRGNKYSAVNLRHVESIEIRIFDSTNEPRVLKRAIEFVFAISWLALYTNQALTVKRLSRLAKYTSFLSNLNEHLQRSEFCA